MGKNLTNEDILSRMVDAKAIDFGALGKVVAELGPDLAANQSGHRMVLFGHRNIVACILAPEPQFDRIDEATLGLGAAMMER